MAKKSKTIDPKAAAYFKGLGISPDASVSVRNKENGPNKTKGLTVHTLLEICEGFKEATKEDPEE